GILTCCPDANQTPPKGDNLFKGDVPSCPDCPAQPWVVLAAVQVDGDGNITAIDNCDCRRLVLSLGGFWWKCGQTGTTLSGPKATQVQAGKATPTTVTVTGTNLDPKATYTFGNGILVEVSTKTATPPLLNSVDLQVTADTNASIGPRTLIVINTDCRTVTLADAIEVTPPAKATLATPSAPRAGLGRAARPARKPAEPRRE